MDHTKYSIESRETAADVVLAVNNESDQVHWVTRAAAVVMALGLDVVFTEAEIAHAQLGEKELSGVLLNLIKHDWESKDPDLMPVLKQLHEAAGGDIYALAANIDWTYLNRLFQGAIEAADRVCWL